MKEKNYIFLLLLFHCFVELFKSVAITCSSGYVALLYGTSGYCAKCDTTCLTCSNEGMNNCVVCPADFTFNSNTSYCIPPNTNQINTLESSYKFAGFSAVDGWNNGYVYQDGTYGTTVYALSPGQSEIYKQFTLDPAHYQFRILVSLWIMDSGSTSADWVRISVYLDGSPTPLVVPNGNVVTNIPVAASAGYLIYPSGWRATNVDTTFPDWSHDNARISFTSSRASFGIRQFIFIQYLCNKTACSRCTDSTNSSCKSCSLSPIRELTNAYPGQCLCNSAAGYFRHPDYDYCVNPCPNRLNGQYFGDPDTKNCLLSCSNPLNYGDPATGICSPTCSATINLGSVARPLYYDQRNKKCVTVCPSTQPYFNAADRTCYSTCPGGKFKNDQNMQCVTNCPDTGVIPLFGSGDKCVQQCVGLDNWGDPNTHLCTATCSFDSSSRKFFQDNSTGRNLCVRVCPYPERFGDGISNASEPYCAEGCPSGYFGDYLDPRHCVSKCTQDNVNGINFYGLKVGDRECVKVCPEASWGESTNYTCVQTAVECKLDSNKYADNNTWLCVAKGTCSKGRYTDDKSQSCVITCPDGTYADDSTKHCETGCSGSYFADPGINKCVQICQTQNLYSDVDSGNKCVSECNQAGSTPFRDPTTKKCVNICPLDKKLFADTTAKSCVYNCTPGTYAYDNSPTDSNKTCVNNCPGLFFADNSTGYGTCVLRCPEDPILFGDVIGMQRLCVSVCQTSKFGDQDLLNGRLCVSTCPSGWFAQNDGLRRCVKKCNSTTYGYNLVCVSPASCPADWVGDPSTNLCVSICPVSQGTFSDFDSKLCVKQCPILSGVKYFADPTKRWCVQTCNESHSLFGNNKTLTCQQKCIDIDSWADAQHANRFCNSYCTDDGSVLYYRNNFTKTCVLSTNCPSGYFGDNSTDSCVAKCPVINTNQQTWGHIGTKTCVEKCYGNLWGDASTGIPLCVPLCPQVPAKWSYDTDMICVTMCPLADDLYGEDFTRTCVTNCPNISDPGIPYQTFAYDGSRRCVKNCPEGTFGDYTTGKCYATPQQCIFGWGDDYNNSCVHLCTGPTPWDSFGDNLTKLCTIFCSEGLYADSYTGTRQCVDTCPGAYDIYGNKTGMYDSFGDDETNRCETYCMTPGYYADWQTHKCQTRCSGDDAGDQPTYSNNVNKRCVISLACPVTPDKLYGDNRTRTCIQRCYSDGTTIEWADNLTRTCIPQCYHINDSSVYPYDTIFYGDISTNIPMCVIKCPQTPRLFGNNDTNLCQSLCPLGTFGDPNNNRSCVAGCYQWNGVIFYSQDDQSICVSYCKDGTFANWHNRHCQTDPKDCVAGEYGDDGNNSCVALCPKELNYFGDPSTKLCVSTCPNLTTTVSGATVIIHTYADYSNRLCVTKCNPDLGLQGTFGDNFTNTCVQRCPIGSYGDALTVDRHCVATCTGSNFADPLTMLCVSKCPASPPYYGYEGNWTCLKVCPDGLWADDQSRKCVDTCPVNSYRLTSFRKQCVSKCPSNPDLYADDDSGNCQSICTLGKFADPTDRKCKSGCLPLFQYNFRCVLLCPNGYYANSTGDCVLPTQCDSSVPYGENGTTKCVATCTAGSFADPNSHYCIAVCPDGWFGDADTCRQTCQTPGTSASTITKTCRTNCPKLTYHQSGECKAQCVIGYANDQLGTCHSSCPLTPIKLFANTLTHDCVQKCPQNQVRDHLTGYCVLNNNGCSNGQFSDQVTGNCVTKCSLGYWGNQHNFSCQLTCINGEYRYESTTQRTCFQPVNVPLSGFYGDPESGEFVTVCPTTPTLYFADRILNLCVETCDDHSGTKYYGDPQTRQCESACFNVTFYTADAQKDKCVLKCTLGTFRFNNSGDPVCKSQCDQGFADSSTRVCVAQCPVHADTYGYHDTNSGDRVCLSVCPDGYYADPNTRQCNPGCSSPLYADNTTHRCVDYCTNSFADDSNQRCMDKCHSVSFPSADNSTNKCVFQCPSSPDYYNQNNVCVYYCQQAGYFADPSTRQCVSRCPNVTGQITYGDETTGRCAKKCPQLYWGDNSTNKCVKTCPTGSFADNQTKLCVSQCPKNQSVYADPFLHACAYTCSNGYFGSQVNQTCVQVCDNGVLQSEKYWGDPLSTMCVNVCPSMIYSYGENVTRKCVTSCDPHQQLGFADNHSRICRDKCQDTLPVETFADPTTSACVQICPQGYYAENTTNECVKECLTGYADNYSRYCVDQCPDDPQSYGDINEFGNKICVHECLSGRFSNNDTNLCDTKCPTSPDFYGDPHLGRCVYFCTQGSYAENTTRQCLQQCPDGSYADNLTRRCVQFCPNVTEGTYSDTTTQKCVRVCPDLFWAQNSTAMCVNDCPKHPNGTQTYQDNISKFCVAQCPFPYFGKNDTHECVLECSLLRTLYGHNQGRVCVTRLDCFSVAGKKYYADQISGTCVEVCSQTLWANDLDFTCVDDCDPVNAVNKIQYRDLNNQKCVSLCSQDPDEYADDISGNCVRKCPPGYYAHSETGFRKCVASCQPYGLFADNSTNRCVTVCPTDPFMYADPNTNKCVYQCADNFYFADNKTQTCVTQCPSDWQLWGDRLTYTCVQLCPDGYFADILSNRECNQQCTSPKFADKWTSTCVDRCSDIRQFYYEDTSTGTGICVEQCPGDSYGYNPDQTCKYKNVDLSSSCPGTYYADRISKQCVKLCPSQTYADDSTKYCEGTCSGLYFADPVTRKCQTQCSSNYFALTVNSNNHTCVQFCPAPYFAENSPSTCVDHCSLLYELETTRSCETYCPEPYFKFDGAAYKDCRTNCTPLFADRSLRYCLSQCNAPEFGNPLTKTCDLFCPQGYYGSVVNRMCVQLCQQGTFADPSTRLCVTQCPQWPLLYADDNINECVQICQNGFGYEQNRTCLSSCPNATVNSNNVIYLADSSNHLCVLQCINVLISFADYGNNVCTQRCPNGFYANNFTKQCLPQCPTVPNDTFAQNSSHICMSQCPMGTFGSSQNLHCVAECWWPNFAEQTTRLCLQTCPDGYFAQNETARCNRNCDPNTYADPTTKRCVMDCPDMHQLFKFDENWSCVSSCPSGYYADDTTRKCMRLCDQPGMYSYELTRQCVRECPVPYRGYDQNHTCILSCPSLYFYNITRNKCTKCPIECLVCTDPTSCLKCATGYNLFNGICDISCQPANGVITYSNPQGICVRICPYLWYGDNSSYACVQNCPVKQYGSNETQLCQNCPQTCASCKSPTFCTVCESSATMAIDKMCYKDCNSTHKFYYNNTCFTVCPNGTYLTYSNVHCGACSANCATCEDNATRCLSCKGKYLFNYACLVKCPQSYFGNKDFECQLCSNTTNNTACLLPLNFSTQVKVQNYQYVIYLRFNQQVDIKKQIEDIIRIKLKVQRRLLLEDYVNRNDQNSNNNVQDEQKQFSQNKRLLSVTDLINNGISYTYEILPNQVIKLYLIIDQTLASPQFTVEILDPTAIISINDGGTLQNSQANFVIEKIDYYPPSVSTKAMTNTAAKFSVIFILLIYALSFFWSDAAVKSIQIIQLALFHATINSPIPPVLYYYLVEFKRSLFQFMPNFFSSFLSPNKSYHPASQKVIDIFVDFNFLRHVGQIFFFIIVFAVLWVIFLFLSNKRLISNKTWHVMFEDVFKRRLKLRAINDVLSLFYVPLIWFGLSQLKDLSNQQQKGYMSMNGALTIIFLLISFVVPVIWTILWARWQSSRFQQECGFMCKRVKSVEINLEIYSQQPSYNDNMISAEQQKTSQKLKIQKLPQSQLQQQYRQRHDNHSKFQPNNPKHQLQTIATYMYLFLMTTWMVTLQPHVIPQLSLLIATNVIYIAYILYFRPYTSVLNIMIIPLMTCTLLLIQAYMVYYKLKDNAMFSQQKTQAAQPLIIVLSVLYVVMILWTIWRVIYDGLDTWGYFKTTPFYLQYGDPNHTVQQQRSEDYEIFNKKPSSLNQYQVGDQVIQKITKTLNQHGQTVIKVHKKIFNKKKPSLLTRRKSQHQKIKNKYQNLQSENSIYYHQQNNRNIDGESIIHLQDVSSINDEFVRINQPTPFELARIIQFQQQQQQQQKLKQQFINRKRQTKMNMRTIDDDIREHSDGDQYSYQDYGIKRDVDKNKKGKHQARQSQFYLNKNKNKASDNNNKAFDNNKKVTIQIDNSQESVHDIEDISSSIKQKNNNNNKQSNKMLVINELQHQNDDDNYQDSGIISVDLDLNLNLNSDHNYPQNKQNKLTNQNHQTNYRQQQDIKNEYQDIKNKYKDFKNEYQDIKNEQQNHNPFELISDLQKRQDHHLITNKGQINWEIQDIEDVIVKSNNKFQKQQQQHMQQQHMQQQQQQQQQRQSIPIPILNKLQIQLKDQQLEPQQNNQVKNIDLDRFQQNEQNINSIQQQQSSLKLQIKQQRLHQHNLIINSQQQLDSKQMRILDLEQLIEHEQKTKTNKLMFLFQQDQQQDQQQNQQQNQSNNN